MNISEVVAGQDGTGVRVDLDSSGPCSRAGYDGAGGELAGKGTSAAC